MPEETQAPRSSNQRRGSPLGRVLAVALAERRQSRRQLASKLFALIALVSAGVYYVYHAAIHAAASGASASLGWLSPRDIMPGFASGLLWLFVLGGGFLAADVRHRDRRERIVDVLDARPVTNAQLLGGRLLALVLGACVPLLLVVLAMQAFGVVAAVFDLPFGETVEPLSLLRFVLLDALPAFAFWYGLVMLLGVFILSRWVVALAAWMLIWASWWLLGSVPAYLAPALSPFGGFVPVSDIVPTFADAETLAQRAAVAVLGIGFVLLAAAAHPRRDARSRAPGFFVGMAAVVIGALGIGGLVLAAEARLAERAGWRDAMLAATGGPAADLEHVDGLVDIEPGERLTLDLDMRVALSAAGQEAAFAFNPGLQVERLRVDGEDAAFSHESGVLRVALAGSATISLQANGIPNPRFAYLDAAVDPALVPASERRLKVLGSEAGIFDRRYVALMPGLHWLPKPLGAASRDVFEADIEVAVPAGYQVAGPGRRGAADGGRYRFAPRRPVSDVALFAGRFERASLNVRGVAIELLLHPSHTRNLSVLAEAREPLVERIETLFEEAENLGVGYAYASLAVVEVPDTLRVFGGGWRMESVQALPGVSLLREMAFPTARFDSLPRLGPVDEDDFDAEGKAESLEGYFRFDYSGGNLLYGTSRNVLGFRAAAAGPGAPALDFVVQELVARLVVDGEAYFSAHFAESYGGPGELLFGAIGSAVTGGTGTSRSVLGSGARAPEVWERALGTALVALDPDADPHLAVSVLKLKGGAVARTILDGLGREQSGALLAALGERAAGGTFTAEDFEAAARSVGADLEALLGDWLRDAALPGFVASGVTAVRLRDDADGKPQFQTLVHLHNGEDVPGLVRLQYLLESQATEDGGPRNWTDTAPLRVDGGASVQAGIVTAEPVAELWLAPYLSLNRAPIRLPVSKPDASRARADEAFAGSRVSDWRPSPPQGIVVDDLDPGFSVVLADGEGVRLGGAVALPDDVDMDEGLPAFASHDPLRERWAREAQTDAWGRYRRTTARSPAGEGLEHAVFTARLPAAGRWRLEYHLPPLYAEDAPGGSGPTIVVSITGGRGEMAHGSYDLTLRQDGTSRPVEFNATGASPGWQHVGEFELAAGEVSLIVSNRTSGSAVTADAIRWRQAD